ncbi:hypothetical protein [uncultured Psychroserpens sp.]|uniref:hypothetical protein n=1 Tax=uncultured Psychroserpens sp. TaxID=255436 RepID=UPI0026022EE7|nr:hypothetical protein [uncultured Psychroserpens sp.]
MRKYVLFYIGFCLLLINCNEDKASTAIKETQEQIDAKTITQKEISDLKYADFGLSADSQTAVNDWQKYQELTTHIEALKKADLNFFSTERLLLKTFFLEFRTEMPVNLQTNEILARITALDTKAQKLNSLLRLNNIEKQNKIVAIKELLVAVSNLNLQINKKFEFEKNNVIKSE